MKRVLALGLGLFVAAALAQTTGQGTTGGTGGSSGSVTSVGLADGSTAPFYTITNSPVTGAGTLTFTLVTQAANCVLAGPTTGAAAQPTCRSLVAADLPTIPSTQISGLGTFATANAATPPAIGGTTPAAGAFTTVTPSSTPGYVHGVQTICRSSVAANNSALANTAEDSLAVCTIPAGAMGTNGQLWVVVQWLSTATATSKTLNVRFATTACTPGTTCTSGTNMMSIAQTSGDAYAQSLSIFSNNNATNANSTFNSTGVSPFSAGYASIASPNLQTTGATYVNINCTDGTTTSGSEYCGIQGYTVLLISP